MHNILADDAILLPAAATVYMQVMSSLLAVSCHVLVMLLFIAGALGCRRMHCQ